MRVTVELDPGNRNEEALWSELVNSFHSAKVVRILDRDFRIFRAHSVVDGRGVRTEFEMGEVR